MPRFDMLKMNWKLDGTTSIVTREFGYPICMARSKRVAEHVIALHNAAEHDGGDEAEKGTLESCTASRAKGATDGNGNGADES